MQTTYKYMLILSFQKLLDSLLPKPLSSSSPESICSYLNPPPLTIYEREIEENVDYEIIDGVYDDFRSKIKKMNKLQIIALINKGISFDE